MFFYLFILDPNKKGLQHNNNNNNAIIPKENWQIWARFKEQNTFPKTKGSSQSQYNHTARDDWQKVCSKSGVLILMLLMSGLLFSQRHCLDPWQISG